MLMDNKHNYQEDYKVLQSIERYVNEYPEEFFGSRFRDYKITYTNHSLALIKKCLEDIEQIDDIFPFANLAYMLVLCSTTVHNIVYETTTWTTSIYEHILDEIFKIDEEGNEDKHRHRLAYLNTMMIKVEALSSLLSVTGIPLAYISCMFNEAKEGFTELLNELKEKVFPYCSNEIIEKLFAEDSQESTPIDKTHLDEFYKKYIEITSKYRDKIVTNELTIQCNNWLDTLETLFGEMPKMYEDDEFIKSFDDIDLPVKDTKG